MNDLVFDIETEGLSADQLRAIMPPFDPSTVDVPTGEFNPAAVKVGNLKDKDKIAEKINAARIAFEQAKADAVERIAAAEIDYYDKIAAKAALSAGTGRVLAIGYYRVSDGKCMIDGEGCTEHDLLRNFWELAADVLQGDGRLIGFNSHYFDHPFLIRRSWLLDIEAPLHLFFADAHRRYWSPKLIDLMKLWGCGNYGESISLDLLDRFLGGSGKNGSGADFARLWHEDRPKAEQYLRDDLRITANAAVKLGVIAPPKAIASNPAKQRKEPAAKPAKPVDESAEEAAEIMELIDHEASEVPEAGEEAAEGMLETAKSIMETVEKNNRASAKQIGALENILAGLQKWTANRRD